MAQSMERRVVITGLGVVSPNGIGKEAFWKATSSGISGIKPIESFPTDHLPIRVAGTVDNFVAGDYIDRKLANRTDRMTHLVFAAIQEALRDAEILLPLENPHRVGAVIANAFGGVNYAVEQLQSLYRRGPRFVSAYTAIAWLQVANAGQVSIYYGLQGYCKTFINDTVGSLDALGLAYTAIRRGAADTIISGGCEAPFHPFSLIVLSHSGQCVKGDDLNAYRPFDRSAGGFFPAEGAGVCILEEYEHARRRGAPIYGEIVGYGQTNSAEGLTVPSSNGKYYARAISLAMQEGGLGSQDIGYFSLDGQAIPASDQGEVDALHRAFGSDLEHLPVSVPRTMLGYSYSAAGALDAITALLALQHGFIPPTINCEELDPRYGLNMVREEMRPFSQPAVLIGGRALGGANVVVALKQVDEGI